MGRPAIIIRVAGCNLDCSWCDTPQRNTTAFRLDPKGLWSYLWLKALTPAGEDVVITGGEPTLYLEPLGAFLDILKKQGRVHVTVESNCTKFWQSGDVDLWSLSPKLEKPTSEIVLIANAFLNTYGSTRVQFKFVVSCPEDLDLLNELLCDMDMQYIRNILDYTPIIIQPNGDIFRKGGLEQYGQFIALISERIASGRLGWYEQMRVLPQLHILTKSR